MFIAPMPNNWTDEFIADQSTQGAQSGGADWPGTLNTSAPSWWKDLTGMSNTEAQNYMAWMLQQDAQAYNSAQEGINREFNAQQAKEAREWQEYMSNTAVQRQMKDYEAAGLNPILAVGNGASSGSAIAASSNGASSGIAGAQAANVNLLATLGTAAAGIGLLLKGLKALTK